MYYYNPETNEKLSREDLKNRLNTSIPEDGIDTIRGWTILIDGPIPETEYGQSIVPDRIEKIGNIYVQTYRTSGRAMQAFPSLDERMSSVEDAIAELAQIIMEEKI